MTESSAESSIRESIERAGAYDALAKFSALAAVAPSGFSRFSGASALDLFPGGFGALTRGGASIASAALARIAPKFNVFAGKGISTGINALGQRLTSQAATGAAGAAGGPGGLLSKGFLGASRTVRAALPNLAS